MLQYYRQVIFSSSILFIQQVYDMTFHDCVSIRPRLLTSVQSYLQLGIDTVASSYVRLLGIEISSDLELVCHVSRISSGCYYRLRQLRHIRRSLDSESVITLVHACIHSWIDYCNTILAGAPRTLTDKLQHVLNAAARVISGIRKFDRGLRQLLHDELHWLDVSDRVFFKLAVTVHQCLNGRAPSYLSDHCTPLSAGTRRHLQPTVWNSLPDFIRDPSLSTDSFRRLLKMYLFARY